MKTRTIRGSGVLPALLLMSGLAAAPAPAAAQDVERTECRCVDADGNEIERCTCFRAPEVVVEGFPEIMGRVFAFGPERPRVGISLDPEQPAEDDARGARIEDILEDGPADEAGLREGDIVVRFDGHDLLSSLDRELEEDFDLDESIPVQRLLALARRLEPGEEVEVAYLRDGERRTTTVEARELEGWGARTLSFPRGGSVRFEGPDAPERMGPGVFRFHRGPDADFELRAPEGPHAPGAPGPRGWMGLRSDALHRCPADGDRGFPVTVLAGGCPGGLRLVRLNPALGEYFGTDSGVLVADVHEDSALGLEPGDVIQRIGDREVDTPERADRIIRSYGEEEPVTFQIVRDGRTMDVQGRLRP